ncbi:MAG: DUF4293 domain-containing protein [Prolixibacteraceae bacterium]|jgi:hypothetical protein|nr:DUF4293 domain-containing protein [Prolixibacteraceae bacterium]HNQ38290.1 DUF4293 domain-containing protein [Prolixibacteraceae bacterium]HOY51488.1 DUF4293 domain-containing protein [Prolixibacteraceae bacterium]HPJ79204.1 DUF4293 domain-containing protein [Prolixibacteraceae bacterium]HRV89291.1 DUF4293 domain-containing protein [Prolixibacteraceae bacterium]
MIQRIQTLFLLVSILLLGLLLWLPLADITSGTDLYQFNIRGIFRGEEMVFNGRPFIVFLFIVVALHLFVIFQYKNRIRQIRILVFSMVLLLGLFGVFFYFAYAGFDGAKASFRIPVAFPLVAIILDYLAIRAIGKDEALIRSLNRIR